MSLPPASSTSVLTILSEENLLQLRKSFSASDFAVAPKVLLGGMYEPAQTWIGPFVDRFFTQNPVLTPDRREQIIISALLAAQASSAYMSVHFYAGLMEGLDVAQIAETLLLAGQYSGVPRLTQAMTALQQTLVLLQQSASNGALTTQAVVKVLLDAFG
ncbi:MAG TPA: carboxymuconolactone decarboxylase family protein [Myxococcaceae bacterium]|jgi:alkylhydroperoxidase/carboxymuconolactone decarboxylase family protein YurZ